MKVTLDHDTENQQCICADTLYAHFRGLNHSETIARLVEALRDADALLKISHSVFGTIRDNLEGNHEAAAIVRMTELTYNAQRIIEGYEDKITRAWLGD